MNVAAVAITLPVALVVAGYLGINSEIVLFSTLAAAGMPLMLLVGAAPNAIAYESRQFSSKEFLVYGFPATLIFLVTLWLFVHFIWPMMGMTLLSN